MALDELGDRFGPREIQELEETSGDEVGLQTEILISDHRYPARLMFFQ